MGQIVVCCQNLPLGEISSRSAPSVLVGELFKKFSLFLNTGVHSICIYLCILFTKGLYFIMVKIFMEFVYDDLLHTRDATEAEN